MELPQRTSLVSQTAEVLRRGIEAGEWVRWLPGEHDLARRLQVSRATLRAALGELERDQLVAGGQGRRREVMRRQDGRSVPLTVSKTVVVLGALPWLQVPAPAVLWMDKLREQLAGAGWLLEYHESPAATRRRPGPVLEDLLERLNPAAWVLYRSTPEMQKWFGDRHLRAVVAGSTHAQMNLSSVDVDFAACCRHAAGRLRALGHERVAVVRPESRITGDVESVAGFEAGWGAEVMTLCHQGTPQSVGIALERVFGKGAAPTGLFVFHVPHLLTVLGWLQQHGLRVPRDVSVICRDHDPLLEHMLPEPSRYVPDVPMFGLKLSRVVADLLAGRAGVRRRRIMPNFIRGATLDRVK